MWEPITGMSVIKTVRNMAKLLKKGMGAEQVWLFGSQARSESGPDSDLDLLAIIPTSSVSRYQRAVVARRALSNFDLPLDIVVLTRAEWEKEIKAPSSLASTVMREGTVF